MYYVLSIDSQHFSEK